MRLLLVALLVGRGSLSVCQLDSADLPFSENGWHLGPHGTIRILVLFAEVEYDRDPSKDPQPAATSDWPKGQLPAWRDKLFDPRPLPEPQAMLSHYYHDISLGDYIVLGDYIDHMFTLRESDYPAAANGNGANKLVIQEANKLPAFHTAHGLAPADFDLWKEGGKPGIAKEPGPDTPYSFDHVMVILRNSSLTHGQGSTDPGSSGPLHGSNSDTQSRFGAMNGLPFEILKHEFNHLLLGGNNFHSGGGNAAGFVSYFTSLQGGWSMMGAASSSLLTCSAWDRDRLGWRAKDACGRVNARNAQNQCVNGDIDPPAGDTGIYVLRDFVTSGDALRIRLPYLGADEFPQWIWIENHQTFARNGSPTDRFHWEETGNTCVGRAPPGLYMQLQVDRDQKRGTDIYGGFADYLHPLTAHGHFDLRLTDDTLFKSCPFHGTVRVYTADAPNALTGNCAQELPVYDRDGNGIAERREHYVPGAESRDGRLIDGANFFGRAEHAFTLAGNRRIGMGTNPSTANALTLVSAGNSDKFHGKKPNNRVIHLNGISVELLAIASDGSATVRIRNNDTYVANDLRWCGDSIVLHAVDGYEGRALWLAAGKRLKLDRSGTITRINGAEQFRGRTWFSDPTRLVLVAGARAMIDSKAKLELSNASELHLLPGSELELHPLAKVTADATSLIVLHGDAHLVATPKQLKKMRKKGRIKSM